MLGKIIIKQCHTDEVSSVNINLVQIVDLCCETQKHQLIDTNGSLKLKLI